MQSKVSGLGLVLKGNGHIMYANTLWGANKSAVCMPSCIERLKTFRSQFPRQIQVRDVTPTYGRTYLAIIIYTLEICATKQRLIAASQ